MNQMRISEVADRVGVPTPTVRYYERVGLIPEPARTRSGYRAYDDAAVGGATAADAPPGNRRGLVIGVMLVLATVFFVWGSFAERSCHDDVHALVPSGESAENGESAAEHAAEGGTVEVLAARRPSTGRSESPTH